MATAADKKRWDKLHADLEKAYAAREDYKSELSVKMGRFERNWLSAAQQKKYDALDQRYQKIDRKIFDMINELSPRNWMSGAPAWWVVRKLTWEDMIRPVDEPLSVVVPGAAGYPDGYVKERRAATSARVRSTRATENRKMPNRSMRSTSELEIQIPDMPIWTQIGGDMDPATYGGTFAKSDGSAIEILKIQPVREYVGDDEAADVGFPFWTREAYYDLADLDPNRDQVRQALGSIDMDRTTLQEDFTPTQRVFVIAEALIDYGSGADEGPSGWSKDIYSDQEVKPNSGAVTTFGALLADEDDEFRREVLGEEDDEDDEEEDDEDDDDPDYEDD